jgi:hypothetical protein
MRAPQPILLEWPTTQRAAIYEFFGCRFCASATYWRNHRLRVKATYRTRPHHDSRALRTITGKLNDQFLFGHEDLLQIVLAS